MTFHAWLERATGGLPREVAERVKAEYAAHIAESGLPEAEAVAALGDPRAVRRALGRTYMNWEQLESLRDGRGLGLIQPLIWGLPTLFGLMFVVIYADAPAFPWWRLVAPALTVLLTALTWRWTRSLSTERRTLWRIGWGAVSIQLMLWLGWLLSFGSGESDGTPLWMLALMAGLLPIHGFSVLASDRRLRRTLALSGGSR